jgi:addiction module HigA family antidote
MRKQRKRAKLRRVTDREPVHPGRVLLDEFLTPNKMTQTELAAKLHVRVQQVNLLVRERRAITARTAIGLSKVFPTTSPEKWMYLQVEYDLWQELHRRR